MVFSSLIFTGMFLPIVYLVNLFLPLKLSNLFLLAASVFLYAWGEPIYVLILLGCIAVNYVLARLIARGNHKKLLVTLAVIANLAVLIVFKYADFLIGTVNGVLGTHIPLTHIVMPIGISFFTFQAMSYVIDVYRGTCEVQTSLIKFALYVSFFPQLIAGPIVKYHEIEANLTNRRVELKASADGLRRFAIGLGKKMLLANVISTMVDKLYGMGGASLNAPLAWIASLGYALQIYFDFSGYSDMAIGMGKMFGFTIPENFNRPFISASLKEFWRRWHISLSSWFKDYLYIPMGGSRKGKLRTHFNKLFLFFLMGLWHGASWNFVLWAMGFTFFMFLENTGIVPVLKLRDRWRWLGIIWMHFCHTLMVVLFRSENLPDAGALYRAMFAGGWRFSVAQKVCLVDTLTPYMLLTIAVAVIVCSTIPEKLSAGLDRLGKGGEALRMVMTLMLLGCCVMALVAQTNNPFIYFRF